MSLAHVQCPGCGADLLLADSGPGNLLQCPGCRARFTLHDSQPAVSRRPRHSLFVGVAVGVLVVVVSVGWYLNARADRRRTDAELRDDLTACVVTAARAAAADAWEEVWRDRVTRPHDVARIRARRDAARARAVECEADVVRKYGPVHLALGDVDPPRAARAAGFIARARAAGADVGRRSQQELDRELLTTVTRGPKGGSVVVGGPPEPDRVTRAVKRAEDEHPGVVARHIEASFRRLGEELRVLEDEFRGE